MDGRYLRCALAGALVMLVLVLTIELLRGCQASSAPFPASSTGRPSTLVAPTNKTALRTILVAADGRSGG
jgi:hypothetical protein